MLLINTSKLVRTFHYNLPSRGRKPRSKKNCTPLRARVSQIHRMRAQAQSCVAATLTPLLVRPCCPVRVVQNCTRVHTHTDTFPVRTCCFPGAKTVIPLDWQCSVVSKKKKICSVPTCCSANVSQCPVRFAALYNFAISTPNVTFLNS